MKYFWWGLVIFIVGGRTYAWVDAKIRRWLFLRKVRELIDEDDKMMAEARRKGLLP